MILKVWDNGGKTIDRYLVRIRNDYYTMSHNANQPNGVNMYLGEYPDITESGNPINKKDYKLLPVGLRKAIADRSIKNLKKGS
jgi:hypothetical protein